MCFAQQTKSGQLISNLLFKESHFLGSMQLLIELTAKEFIWVGRNNNLPTDGKILDVEFQKNGETWVLDVRFTKPHNEEERFQRQINISLCTRIELFLS